MRVLDVAADAARRAHEAGEQGMFTVEVEWPNLDESTRERWRDVVGAVVDVIDDGDLGDCGCGASAQHSIDQFVRCPRCGHGRAHYVSCPDADSP